MTPLLTLGALILLACCVSTGAERRVVCEGQRTTLSCGSSPIKVLHANYGRTDRRVCSSRCPYCQIVKTNCVNRRTLPVVKSRCDGRTSCSLVASCSLFSDPCHGTYKYLDVTYICLHPKRIVSCEGSVSRLRCGWGTIRVQGAAYGRRSRSVCSSRQSWSKTRNTRCARSVTSSMARRCNGRKACNVKAANNVFGDPCRGTYKYLDVNYTCS
ncbi:L-rhamnose-binding lectin CSL3-like [Hypomesus transpacificus]|uniref:L-rhamnose-binding lectin CSL3-like n=1 Tax=Hypomesus transpacificus TaxID=137520 RepID=UPI001F07FA49|nr:L-rhamnose-binding lectin CSL3-like [Hypomesus transpacificus]